MEVAGTKPRRTMLLVGVLVGLMLVAAGLASCFSSGQKDETVQPAPPAASETAAQEHTTAFTFPAFLFVIEDADSFVSWVNAQGFEDAHVNGDGSVTVNVADSEANAFKASVKQRAGDVADSITGSSLFPSVKKVEHDAEFGSMTITMDKTELDSGSALAGAAVALPAAVYRIAAGESSDVEVTFLGADGTALGVRTYPDAAGDDVRSAAGDALDMAQQGLSMLEGRLPAGE